MMLSLNHGPASPPGGNERALGFQGSGRSSASGVLRDLSAGLVVFLVAVPLCLGVALASGAPLFAGLLAGIIGGVLVGALSGSQTSVSGPDAGLTVLVVTQIATLGSFQAFLLALVLAGVFQIVLGIVRAGSLSAFFPSSVIKGLLVAIGVILVLKQIPHVLGHDSDPEGEMAFAQPDRETTFSEFGRLIGDMHPGAAAVGLTSVALLLLWSHWKPLKRSGVPGSLIVALLGVGLGEVFRRFGGGWAIGAGHLVQVPLAEGLTDYLDFLQYPDFSQLSNPAIYTAAVTIAAVASLVTLLNLEAVDKIDPRQRSSPPNRELMAQGVGNMVAGLVGGLPVTSMVIRSSVNVEAGSKTKLATIFHGVLLLASVVLLPAWLNMIPLSCLAAILFVTGMKLASPSVFRQMWDQGRQQFVPFVVTVAAIIFTDLLIGILIGLAASIGFILHGNVRRPMRRIVEKHLGGEVLRLELATQVSFLNRASLARTLDEVPRGGHILLDARRTDYIDPDVLALIRDFKQETAPARGVEVSLRGFRDEYRFQDQTLYLDYATRELQDALTPAQVLELLRQGHQRFHANRRLSRDVGRLVHSTADGQHPLAVVLGCIDSRTPAELLFDVGLGDVFSVRVAGNVPSREVIGSVEYGCILAGAKLIVVLGHTRCGAVTAAVNLLESAEDLEEATGCQHLGPIIHEIQRSLDGRETTFPTASEKELFINESVRRNVERVVDLLPRESPALAAAVRAGKVGIVGAVYDVVTGNLEFLPAAEYQDLPEVVSAGS